MTKRGLRRKEPIHDPLKETSAFMREVDESMKMERMTEIWNKYRVSFFVSLALLFVAVAGKEYYIETREASLSKASENFWMYERKLSEGMSDSTVLESLITEGKGAYVEMARFQKGKQLAEQGDFEKAAAEYAAIAMETSYPKLAELSTFYQGQALMEVNPEEAISVFKALIEKESIFSFSAQEFLAYTYEKTGDRTEALSIYEGISDERVVPGSIARRAKARLALIKRLI